MRSDYYHDIDLHANQLLNIRLHNVTSAERAILGSTLNAGSKGYEVYDTNLLLPFIWDGTQWVAASGGSATWGYITGVITNQSDLINYLANNYYPLNSNPAGYLTLGTLPTPVIPNLQQVTTSGSVTTNGISIASLNLWDSTHLAYAGIKIYNGAFLLTDYNNDYVLNVNRGFLSFYSTGGDTLKFQQPATPSTQTYILPNIGGTFALSVNGITANANGDVIIPIGTGTVTGTGVPTRVAFWDSTSSISSDPNLYWDDTSKILLIGINTVQTNGKLQVGGSIGLTGNSQIRQASNVDGNTLQVFATQFVAGPANSISYQYTGGGLIASVSNADGQVLLDTGRIVLTNGRVKVVNSPSNLDTILTVERNGIYTLFASTLGNVGIGTGTPAYKLDVNGTAGSIALNVNGNLNISNGGNGTNTLNGVLNYFVSQNNKFYGHITRDPAWYQGDIIDLSGNAPTNDAQSWAPILLSSGTVTRTSGTATSTMINLQPTYNYSGTYSGITRGIYYAPIFTNLNSTTHTAWENTSGDIIHGNLAFTGTTNKVVTVNSTGKLINDDIVTNFIKYGDILTQQNYAGRTLFVSPVAMNGALFSTGFGTTTQAQWTITDVSSGGTLNARTRTYRWKNRYNTVASFTGSTSGTTLTTVGSPALFAGCWIRLDNGTETGLGQVISGSANTWTLSISTTQASQSMKAIYGSRNVYSAGAMYFGFWPSGYPGSISATFKVEDPTTGTISTSASTTIGTNISVNAAGGASYWKVPVTPFNYITDIIVSFVDDGTHYINYQTHEMVINYSEGVDIIPYINKDGGKMYGTLSFVNNPDGLATSTKGSITNAGALIMTTGKFTALPTSTTGVNMVTVASDGTLGQQTIPSGGSSPLTTKGDLYTFSTVNARLGVGSNGQVLTVDSTAATGLKWGDTPGTLYKFSSTTYQSVSGTSTFVSSAISGASFTNGDLLKIDTVVATTISSLAAVGISYHINTSPTITGATQIANYSAAFPNIYIPMNRVYWANGTNFYGRNFSSSTSNSQNATNSALATTAIPSTFYIIVQIATTGTDLAGLSSFVISKT
jgi:hypothetical protein